MQFKRLRTTDSSLYKQAMEVYQASFPIHEQREQDSQLRIMQNEAYHFNLIYNTDGWVGLLLGWETPTFLYVEHFCILPELRNHQYGERALTLLNEMGKTVILEIDPPVDDVSIRRKSFYERSGYQANSFDHVHPPYHKNFDAHRLVVMSCPDRLSEANYHAFRDHLHQVVMGN